MCEYIFHLWEFQMEMFSLLALGALMVLGGGAATYLMAVRLPQHLLDRAQGHGRFAGLEPAPRGSSGGSGRRMRVAAPIFGALQAI
jgi:hypothetical protein